MKERTEEPPSRWRGLKRLWQFHALCDPGLDVRLRWLDVGEDTSDVWMRPIYYLIVLYWCWFIAFSNWTMDVQNGNIWENLGKGHRGTIFATFFLKSEIISTRKAWNSRTVVFFFFFFLDQLFLSRDKYVPKGSFGSVWRQFWLSQLGGQRYCHWVGRGQGCC